MKQFLLCMLVAVVFLGCKDDEALTYDEQLAIDVAILDEYLANNNIVAEVHSSGLRYVIHEQGSGLTPTLESGIIASYEGTFLDGEVFDSNSEFTFRLSNLIDGWQIGLPFIQEGGDITLYIPSGLGYGTRGTASGSIPGNTNIIFSIQIIEIRQ